MDKEAFVAKFQDEMVGLLLEAFADERAGTMELQGKRMIARMRKAKDLLGRMHDAMNGKPLATVKGNGK